MVGRRLSTLVLLFILYQGKASENNTMVKHLVILSLFFFFARSAVQKQNEQKLYRNLAEP